MRKLLLSFGVAAVTLSASADKVVFIAADALSAWAETPAEIADANQTIVMPEGFYFLTPADRAPKVSIEKPLASNYLSISAIKDRAELNGTPIEKVNNSYVTSGGLRWYDNCWFNITPAKGVTVKNIIIRSQSASYCKTINMVKGETTLASTVNTTDAANTFQTLAVNSSEAFKLHASKQNRVFYIIFETEGTPAGVMQPKISPDFGAVSNTTEITLTAPTTGSEIYYTLDGSAPTTSSAKYTAPIKLTEGDVVRAIAAKGEETSFEIYQDYMVMNAEESTPALFDFTNFTTLYSKADGITIPLDKLPIAAKNLNIPITTDNVFVNNGVEATVSSGKIFRSWTFGNVVELRPDNGATLTLTAPENKYISYIYLQGSKIAGQQYDGEEGMLMPCMVNSSKALWSAADGKTPKSVTLTSSIADEYINQVYVYLRDVPGGSGVAEIGVDENAPVEYYNLQGIRVENPENGLYIVKQGNKVTKKVIR